MEETYYDKNKDSRKLYQREYYKNGRRHRTPESRREEYRKYNEKRWKKRGIIIPKNKSYEEQYADQNGLCDICKSPYEKKALSMDHDHKSGKARGLLCDKCNIGLGFFRDNVEFLTSAAIYLQKHHN